MTRLSKPSANDMNDVRKGAWGADEDEKLRKYVETYGTGHWRSVGKKAGLKRCGKSCRLRWTNYLRPDIRHGSFSEEEEDLIVKLHSLHGSRWSLIAAQLPRRTDNDIKNHWNTRLKKKLCDMGIDPVTHKPIAQLLRDLAETLTPSGSAANPDAVEEAQRCFRDTILNKAVRHCGRPLAVQPFFTCQIGGQDNRQPSAGNSLLANYYHSNANQFEMSANNSDYSRGGPEESFSERPPSPTTFSNLNQSTCNRDCSGEQCLQEEPVKISEGSYVYPNQLTIPANQTLLRLRESAAQSVNQVPSDCLDGQSVLLCGAPKEDAINEFPNCDRALGELFASSSAPIHIIRNQTEDIRYPQESLWTLSPRPRFFFVQGHQSVPEEELESLSRVRFGNSQELNGMTKEPTCRNTNRNHPHNLATTLSKENLVELRSIMHTDGASFPTSSSDVGAAGPFQDILRVNEQFPTSNNPISSFITSNVAESLGGSCAPVPSELRLNEYEVHVSSAKTTSWDC